MDALKLELEDMDRRFGSPLDDNHCGRLEIA
jgi:hypothetical protein